MPPRAPARAPQGQGQGQAARSCSPGFLRPSLRVRPSRLLRRRRRSREGRSGGQQHERARRRSRRSRSGEARVRRRGGRHPRERAPRSSRGARRPWPAPSTGRSACACSRPLQRVVAAFSIQWMRWSNHRYSRRRATFSHFTLVVASSRSGGSDVSGVPKRISLRYLAGELALASTWPFGRKRRYGSLS